MFPLLSAVLVLLTPGLAWGPHKSCLGPPHDPKTCSHMGTLLTYYINGDNGPCWPGFLPFIVIPEIEEGSLFSDFSEDRYISGDEVATFIEVGGAYHPDGKLIGDLGVEDLFLVETIHIDLTDKAAIDSNYEVTVDDIDEWICNHGPIPPRAFVIFNTGWSFKRGNRYYGPDTVVDLDELSYELNRNLWALPYLIPGVLDFAWPGISAKAAEYLLECFFIIGIGIDTPSVDAGRYYDSYISEIPDSRGVRRFLTTYGIYLVHNLLFLDIHVPARGMFSTLGVFNMCKATRAPVNVYVEYCVDAHPQLRCQADDYKNVVFRLPHRRI